MQEQLALRRSRLAAGHRHLGWKVGFGAPAAMESLRLDGPLVGFLTDGSLVAPDEEVSIQGWVRAVAEPELAAWIRSDVPTAASPDEVRAAIGALGPAIELADVDPQPEDVEQILAGNIFHRRVILGHRDPARAGASLEGFVGRVWVDDDQVAEVSDPEAVTGPLLRVVAHVAATLAAVGEGLKAGDIVITGSIVPPIPLAAPAQIRFEIPGSDPVTARVR